MNNVDPELFIAEIKKRPALWDQTFDSYKDKSVRQNQWYEMCSLFCMDFEERTPAEQDVVYKEVMAKWRSIRDAYVRFMRLKDKKTSKKRAVKPYIYAKQLEFLSNPNHSQRPPSPSADDSDFDAADFVQEIFDEHINAKPQIEDPLQCSSSTVDRKRKAEDENVEENSVNEVRPRIMTIQDCDSDDMDFFKSLLPMLRAMPFQDKLKFRRDVLNALIEFT
ncbi:uncharacterized protein LOC128990527 [Macrosteles quadrilineatus]|uniref:uncharacterized protein LOC128990527 n=1 Tax=Macrosteles quadrilineatus TaxID=74068 RepID=UPI0023E2C6D0|nr:uncharacterized protein LOC128990527 [Macrosteles quadrilineatus]